MDEVRSTVLLDASPGEDADFDVSFLERLGHPVAVCKGPEVKSLCPLLGGKGCEKFEESHGIVFKFDLDRPQHRAILRRYHELGREDLPMRALVRPEQAERYKELLAGITVWLHEPTAADLDGFAAEVEAADRLAEG